VTPASTTITLPGPLDVPGSLGGLQRWGDDLIDRWDGGRWLRVLRIAGQAVPARIVPAGSIATPVLEISSEPVHLAAVTALLTHAFVTAPEPLAALAADDPAIGEADRRYPGIRPLLTLDPLTALVRSISAQQVNLRWATEIRRRLAERYGIRYVVAGEPVHALDAGALAAASVEELRAIQLTTVKAKSVVGVARATVEGRLELTDLAALDDESVIERLTVLYGIGRWSAEWFLARTLGRPAVVAGDLGVRKAVGRAYFGGRMPSEAEVRAATAHWGEAAGVAQQLLLHGLVADAAPA
jgi:DNA-3-methyladenine glycosylase II